MTNKKMMKRISVAMLAMTLLSVLCLATMVFAEETTGAADAETVVYDFVENKDDGGFFKSILGFFGKILNFCNQITGNYIFALFLFSLLMQLALCFVGIKQQKNSVGQARLAPKIAAINKKYAGRNDQATLQKKQQETMELYQKEGFNPMGGCLPLLIQMPVIMILYYVVIAPMQYILGLSATDATNLNHLLKAAESAKVISGYSAGDTRAMQMNIINWFRQNGSEGIKKLEEWIETIPEAYENAAEAYAQSLAKISDATLPNFSVGPVDLAQIPSFTGNTTAGEWLLLLVPALTLVFLLLTQNLTKRFTYQTPESKEMQERMSMKIMTWSMPLLSVYFTFVVPAAIGVYWIFRNILNLCQQMILYKVMPIPKYSEEDYKAAERELMGSSQRKKEKAASRALDPNRPKVRSLHHIDDEGYDNGYKIDPNALKEEEEEVAVGTTTENKDAPAPIKNDEKSSYAPKKKKASDKSEENK